MQNSFHVFRLLSESYSGEYDVAVIARKRTGCYDDERNCRSMPAVWLEAGRMM